uniref:peptidylprolyl isomerase n=1 Tax=Aureoumbra lagunensis TaxID=44058 RepID=A0A7S3NPX8_9STRA|mmetsp:Transcript_4428/g.6291  ORF Transcript_4428/g.6291 Transcript_4428/m.6291 type:complete len:180 (-) Transcript_4428:73-612(-)
MRVSFYNVALCLVVTLCHGLAPNAHQTIGRRSATGLIAGTLLSPPLISRAAEYTTTSSGLQYKVLKSAPDGAMPKTGDLIAIRFKGSVDGRVFDDITETPEPLYYRIGDGSLIKGIDEALPMMRLGETWNLIIPGNLGFGPKGRSASAGKPRIPSNAELQYEVSIVGFPGFEGDLIDTV